MKPEIMTLCEYASDNNGRLTIVDTFETIIAAKMPWRAYFSIAARIDLAGCVFDCKTLSMKITSANDSSKVVFEAESPFDRPKDFGKLNIVAGFKGLIFTESGDYIFTIMMDNVVIAECPFKVLNKGNE